MIARGTLYTGSLAGYIAAKMLLANVFDKGHCNLEVSLMQGCSQSAFIQATQHNFAHALQKKQT